MTSVDKHISELLYDYDCVVVPNFGGFVANYSPAIIHPTQHTFVPPSKKIVFNKNLKNNDGLLANQIVAEEKKEYSVALKHIDQFVKEANHSLSLGAKVKIESVGTLFFDVERNIQFEPSTTNFLTDAFGLSVYQSQAINRGNIIKRAETKFIDRTPLPPNSKNKKFKRIASIALTIPIVISLIWLPIKTSVFKTINYSSLNPLASSAKVERRNNAQVTSENKLVKITKDSVVTNSLLNSVVEKPIETTTVKQVRADSTLVSKNVSNALELKFHLVVGCFKVATNAENFETELRQQNLNASIIGQNKDGLYVVSCGNFPTLKEAYSELSVLRKQQPSAWLYKN